MSGAKAARIAELEQEVADLRCALSMVAAGALAARGEDLFDLRQMRAALVAVQAASVDALTCGGDR